MKPWTRLLLFIVIACQVSGCGNNEEHGHPPGRHGGIIVALGDDHYHAEALFTESGELKLFMLGQDESELIQVARQDVSAYLATQGNARSREIVLRPDPQPGDGEEFTSAFSAPLPRELGAGIVQVVVPSIEIEGKRYRFSFATTEPLMPAKVTDEEERELYLTSGGKYTDDDIRANGSSTASERYRGFQSQHDRHPKPGDRICPITNTVANPSCTWIIGGEEYQFCCPPCIDEFVRLAKEQPDQVRDAAEYVQP